MENGALLEVDAWTDFLCPYSFLTSLSLRRLRSEIPLEIHWRSMLTHPEGLPPPSPSMRANYKMHRREAAACARDDFGLELKPGPLEIDTLGAHRALKHAERSGFGDAAHLAIMRAYWLDEACISDPDVLDTIVHEAGVAAAGVPWSDPALDELIDADIGLAQTLDLYFVPAVRFGERMIVAGAEPYDHLRSAARLAAAEAAHPAGHTDVLRPEQPRFPRAMPT